MTTLFQHNEVLSTPFMQEVRCAFKHIASVETAFRKNDLFFFLGHPMESLLTNETSFEEYFVRNLLKKCQNIVVGQHDPHKYALDKFVGFMRSQEHNGLRVKTLFENLDTSTDVGKVLIRTREILHDLFSDFQEYNVVPRFTSGATITLSKNNGSSPFKRFKASEGMGHLLKIAEQRQKEGLTRLSFSHLSFPFKEGDDTWYVNADFVPKTWKEHRLIGNQPSGPLALQCGVGDWMTKRLHRVGIHIDTAQETHKRVARLASLINSHLMTLDQSNASDNIVRWLVKFTIPGNLYEYLVDISPSDIHIGEEIKFRSIHMMATAGNGYIFPLQTAIFWALAKATCEARGVKAELYSYGDDLIAPCAIFNPLRKVFDAVGLQINTEKTFLENGIRESCGGDYVHGTDVRPLYVKEIPTTILGWYRCINGIRRVGFDNNVNCWRTNSFRRLWLWCISRLKPESRLFAPIHYGDVAIGASNYELYKLSYNRTYTINGVKCKYPHDGLHPTGYPYSGWYIETYSTKSRGRRTSFGQESQGIRADDLLRLVPLSSVKGAGLQLLKTWFDDKNVKLKKPVYTLDYPSMFCGDELVVERIRTPLFLSPPAPSDNINDLFRHLHEECVLHDVDAVVQRGKIRFDSAIVTLLEILSLRVATLRSYESEAQMTDLSF